MRFVLKFVNISEFHKSVFQNEVIKYLNPKPGENFIDATVDGGGHTVAILEKIMPRGKVLGIEIDRELYTYLAAEIKNQKSKIKNNVILVNDSFINLKEIINENNFGPVAGILFDLGFSSWHLESSGRGFSFRKNEPLKMNYESRIMNQGLTAEMIVNQWSENELKKIFQEYGEERFAKRITEEIVRFRKNNPIKTTFDLVEIIKKATPYWYQRRRIHPATKVFQALRIAVNDELGNLKKSLPQALEILSAGGRIAVISFHSLEDRIVKNFFKEEAQKNNLKILTKKPVSPSLEELKENPRSRSAKLRAAIKI